MACTYLHILPILAFVWFPVTFIITFIVSAALGHINPLFPYISDTGTISPESCIFGQLVNLGILLLAFVMYIRYRQIREIYQNHNLPYTVQKLNFVSIIIGIIGVFGVSIVGNFQETNVIIVHLLGAFVGFGLGAAYLVLQTVISYKLFPMAGKHWILNVRVALASVCVLTFFLCLLFAILAIYYFKGPGDMLSKINEFLGNGIMEMIKWSEEDGGYALHIVSTVSEWLTALCTMFYILTFSPEFRRLSISEPVLHIEDNLYLNQSDHPVS